jgi:hypothetical protein
MRTLLLAEPHVDHLIRERPVASLAEGGAFVPHFGGAAALPDAVDESARAVERWGALA